MRPHPPDSRPRVPALMNALARVLLSRQLPSPDVLVMPDGSMLVSDDQAGVIYKITYAGK